MFKGMSRITNAAAIRSFAKCSVILVEIQKNKTPTLARYQI